MLVMARLVECGDHEARLQLATDLLGQRVTELHRRAGAERRDALLHGERLDVGVRQRVADHQLPSAVEHDLIEHVEVGVDEAGQQEVPGPQHPEAFTPDRPDRGAVAVRDRVEDQVEARRGDGSTRCDRVWTC